MKKLLILLILVLFSCFAYAEITDTGLNVTAYYSFDDGTVDDFLGNYDAIDGGSSNASGIVGSARQCNSGEGDFINLTPLLPPLLTQGKGTVVLWFRPTDLTGDRNPWGIYGALNSRGRISNYGASNKWEATLKFVAWEPRALPAGGASINTWYMLAFKQNGTAADFYINGVSKGMTTASTNWFDDFGDTITSQFLCGSAFGNTPSLLIQGKVDEVIFYNEGLTQAAVDYLWNAGAGRAPNITIVDTTFPQWQNFNVDAENVSINNIAFFNVTLSDNQNLDCYKFAHNMSGTWTNVSTTCRTAKTYVANHSLTVAGSAGDVVCGKFWFNDTSNNINFTYPLNHTCFTAMVVDKTLKFGIRNNNTKDLVIQLWNNGDGNFNGTVTADDYITNTKPSELSNYYSHKFLMDMDTSTEEGIHKTMTPCMFGKGTSLQCLLLALVGDAQYQNERINEIVKLNNLNEKQNTQIRYLENSVKYLKQDKELLLKKVDDLSINIKEILVATNKTIPSFNNTASLNATNPKEIK